MKVFFAYSAAVCMISIILAMIAQSYISAGQNALTPPEPTFSVALPEDSTSISIYTDPETFCQYLVNYRHGEILPRTASNGKTQRGCTQ